MEKGIVPKPPTKFLQISQKDKDLLDLWISFFKNLSPRIKIVLSQDQEFDMDYYKKSIILNIREEIDLLDWPEKEKVAFFLTFDSSFPNQKPKFLLKNSFLFCFKDIAFGFEDFEWDGDEEDFLNNQYSLRNYPEKCLSWKFINENRIIKAIKELEDSIKGSPI